ncbi:hypothetical protein BHE74_00059652 [Ensete ventricosum]|nr:hypothetical protein BHE74_00059652 [Ensete ventricosum]
MAPRRALSSSIPEALVGWTHARQSGIVLAQLILYRVGSARRQLGLPTWIGNPEALEKVDLAEMACTGVSTWSSGLTFPVSDGVKRTRTSPSMRPAVEKPRRRDVSDESRGRRWRPGLDGRREDGARETPE